VGLVNGGNGGNGGNAGNGGDAGDGGDASDGGSGGDGHGGSIYVAGGTVTLIRSAFSQCSALGGAGGAGGAGGNGGSGGGGGIHQGGNGGSGIAGGAGGNGGNGGNGADGGNGGNAGQGGNGGNGEGGDIFVAPGDMVSLNASTGLTGTAHGGTAGGPGAPGGAGNGGKGGQAGKGGRALGNPSGVAGKDGTPGSDGFAGTPGQDSGSALTGSSAGDTIDGAVTSDTTPPTITLNAADVTGSNARKLSPYTFTVTYTDPVLMAGSSFRGTVVHVAQPGGGAALTATAIKTVFSGLQDGQGDAQTVTVTYRFTPPSGAWTAPLNGTYTIDLVSHPPTDLAGNPAATGPVGTFTVNVPSPPIAFHPTSLPSALVGTAYHQGITATGGSGKLTVSYDIMSGPPVPDGLTFTVSGTHLTISGKPTSGGPVIFSVTATDAAGDTATQSYTLIINQRPKITSVKQTTFTVGDAGTFTVTVSGYPVPGVTESGRLPSGVTFDRTSDTLSGTPAAGTAGTYPIVFTAHSAAGTATQKFTLTIN
jgi:hypothetical protein